MAATLTVTANAATRQYGLANPAFTGTVTAPNFVSSSDARLKSDIAVIPDALQKLRALTGGEGELAILDVREEGVHARGHLFLQMLVGPAQLVTQTPQFQMGGDARQHFLVVKGLGNIVDGAGLESADYFVNDGWVKRRTVRRDAHNGISTILQGALIVTVQHIIQAASKNLYAVAVAPVTRTVLSKVAVSTLAKAASRPGEPWLAAQLVPKPVVSVPHEPLVAFQVERPV